MNFDIYIIFDGYDRELAHKVYKILSTKYNLSIFIDEKLDTYTFNELKNKLKNSSYLLVLYSEKFKNNIFCKKELEYFLNINSSNNILMFSLDGTNYFQNTNLLLVDKTNSPDIIANKTINKIFNKNKIFSFKKYSQLDYINNENLLKQIFNSYIFLFISFIILGLIFLFFVQIPIKKETINLADTMQVTMLDNQYLYNLPISKALPLSLQYFKNNFFIFLSFFFTISGLYWIIFFKLNKEYIKILGWFYKFDFKDIKSISITLSFSIIMEFIINITQGKNLSPFALILLFIFFISYLFIGYLSTILIKYEISHFNKKFLIKIGRMSHKQIKDKIIVFPYLNYDFNDKLYYECINKEEEWFGFKTFLFALIFFPKYWIYDYFIVPIKKIKFCKNKNNLYIKQELKNILSSKILKEK